MVLMWWVTPSNAARGCVVQGVYAHTCERGVHSVVCENLAVDSVSRYGGNRTDHVGRIDVLDIRIL